MRKKNNNVFVGEKKVADIIEISCVGHNASLLHHKEVRLTQMNSFISKELYTLKFLIDFSYWLLHSLF